MFSRYRYPLLAVLSLALLGAAPLAQARDRHVDFSIHLPHLSISSGHDLRAPHPGYYQPRVVRHYHGRQICHLRHESRYEHDRNDDRHRHYRDQYYRH